MRASIIRIGNSRGLRLPKVLLEESGIGSEVEIVARDGEIRIVPVPEVSETALASEQSLARDWDRPEEDEAWSKL